jgi:hypothetical protein
MRPPYLRKRSWLRQHELPTKEQPMFPTAHPDIMVQLANARIADLQANAARLRRARPFLAGWGKARFVEPVADLSRVSPAAEAEAAEAGRAA